MNYKNKSSKNLILSIDTGGTVLDCLVGGRFAIIIKQMLGEL